MEEARVTNEMCYNGCFVCLASAWGFVKMILCCRCRLLGRLICPERPLRQQGREETSEDLTLSDVESDPPRVPRVRFRSVAEVFLFVLPPGSCRQSVDESSGQELTVENIEEGTKESN